MRAIIPARGGSKGVPGKNIMERARGQSLLAYAIACCRDAELVDSVVVSTDHDMIAEEATRCGAIVCWRPASMARDTSSVTEALRHCLARHPADIAATVQCTSPMLSPADIDGTIRALEGHDLAVCCVEFDGLVLDGEGRMINLPLDYLSNRQQRAPQWLVNGHCWAYRPAYLDGPWMSGRVAVHRAEYPHRLEIDTPADVELMRAVLSRDAAS